MFNIILYQPEIPQNTGNIIRLCANTGVQLHLVKPLGFILRDKQLLRAGLDYHEFASIKIHENWSDCARFIVGKRLFAITTKGKTRYDSIKYTNSDAFLFGSETMGLPEEIISSLSTQMHIRVPMVSNSRSLNLSNTVAIITYEAWRQTGFQSGI
ncbi:tRNA (cytidine/uridine-2'-O-)-methyltransferase [Nitrosomonas aestuarii]|uniref:tRNA (cytidine(34)-2'-O)-methyltransferase n=1 Tax=Nitrosomonas aestuarii TaxID=52441 RepID=A0A1I3ZDV9_9PROT|nr:tRNA (uridine(34)/cytosine(34)/5-carboxymethylaminomethyluridine(34)-2'-O)-methyltransferase TrmL [Nitrosomonas aestuarii]SFK42237.1 tRNA (cytidine/uridine-2'-O-)-methyltransferase [Nitrosomonas aestuarii]